MKTLVSPMVEYFAYKKNKSKDEKHIYQISGRNKVSVNTRKISIWEDGKGV